MFLVYILLQPLEIFIAPLTGVIQVYLQRSISTTSSSRTYLSGTRTCKACSEHPYSAARYPVGCVLAQPCVVLQADDCNPHSAFGRGTSLSGWNAAALPMVMMPNGLIQPKRLMANDLYFLVVLIMPVGQSL